MDVGLCVWHCVLLIFGVVARLPISTSALIIATQLAFTAGSAFFMFKHNFNFYSINIVVLLTVGACVLALHTSVDRLEHETNREYIFEFVMTLGALVLYEFILPLVELTYKKTKQEVNFTLVMEVQTVICLFATVFCTVGILINNDFKVCFLSFYFYFYFLFIIIPFSC